MKNRFVFCGVILVILVLFLCGCSFTDSRTNNTTEFYMVPNDEFENKMSLMKDSVVDAFKNEDVDPYSAKNHERIASGDEPVNELEVGREI